MSLFWDYFKDGLKWPLIRRDGALSALARGGAGSLDAARAILFWLRDQFLTERCLDDYVEAHASGRAIRRWYRLPDNTQSLRDLTTYAYSFYRRGGRASGVELVLDLAGYQGMVMEGEETNPPLPPYFFDVVLEEAPGAIFEELLDLICSFKPARSWISSVRMPDCSGRFVLDYSELSRDCLSDVYGWLYGGVKWCFARRATDVALMDEAILSPCRTSDRMYWMPVYSDWLDWSILDESLPLLNPVGTRYSLRPVDSVVDLPPSETCWWRTFKCQQVLDEWGTLSGGAGFIWEWEYASVPDGFPILSGDEPPYLAPIIEFFWNDRSEAIATGVDIAKGNLVWTTGLIDPGISGSVTSRDRWNVEGVSVPDERSWAGEWDEFAGWDGGPVIGRMTHSTW